MNLDEIKLIVESLNGATESAASLIGWWLAINAGKFLLVFGLCALVVLRLCNWLRKLADGSMKRALMQEIAKDAAK